MSHINPESMGDFNPASDRLDLDLFQVVTINSVRQTGGAEGQKLQDDDLKKGPVSNSSDAGPTMNEFDPAFDDYDLGLFEVYTNGSDTQISQAQGKQSNDEGPMERPGSNRKVIRPAPSGWSRAAASASTRATQASDKEDPELNITFQFVGKPKATTTVNADYEIRMYCKIEGKPRKVAFAHAILRAKGESYYKFNKYYLDKSALYEPCEVLGSGVKGWGGLTRNYMDVSDTATYIIQVDGKK